MAPASLNAADPYREMGFGNPDLSPETARFDEVVAIQPRVGDFVDRYKGFGEGYADINPGKGFRAVNSPVPSGESAVIYVGPGRRF